VGLAMIPHLDPKVREFVARLAKKVHSAKTRKRVACPYCKGKGVIKWVQEVQCGYCGGKGSIWMLFKPSTWPDEWWVVLEEEPLEEG